ncbi:MAG: hypothetical protein AAFP90_22325, partial [Planctomycetota bacterium]
MFFNQSKPSSISHVTGQRLLRPASAARRRQFALVPCAIALFTFLLGGCTAFLPPLAATRSPSLHEVIQRQYGTEKRPSDKTEDVEVAAKSSPARSDATTSEPQANRDIPDPLDAFDLNPDQPGERNQLDSILDRIDGLNEDGRQAIYTALRHESPVVRARAKKYLRTMAGDSAKGASDGPSKTTANASRVAQEDGPETPSASETGDSGLAAATYTYSDQGRDATPIQPVDFQATKPTRPRTANEHPVHVASLPTLRRSHQQVQQSQREQASAGKDLSEAQSPKTTDPTPAANGTPQTPKPSVTKENVAVPFPG